MLQIDTLTVEEQVFAQVTDVSMFTTCESEEGVFGLGFSAISSHNYPTFLSNLATPGKSNLKHALFSLYLNPHDDYPDDKHHTGHVPDAQGNMEFGSSNPESSSSQIVFGGVDQTHYEGCLSWHDLGQFEYVTTTDETFEGYWDFALEQVLVGGTTLSNVPLAIVDSGSSYIVGPTEDVAVFAHVNNAVCFQLPGNANIAQQDPVEVDCMNDDGFDAAMIECDQPFFNLEFIADGVTYALEKEDIILRVDTAAGPACVLRIVGTDGITVS